MFLVGLTGGIGSGKSTLAALLMERGAQVIDADLMGREALQPGTPAWHSVVGQFGDSVLTPVTLEIDRKVLRSIVFSDKRRLATLNAIVHPVIVSRIADELERLQDTDDIVVIDAALIVEFGLRESVDVLVVVTCNKEARRHRAARSRGLALDEVGAIMAAQTTEEELAGHADIIVRNDGPIEDLAVAADKLWDQLLARQAAR